MAIPQLPRPSARARLVTVLATAVVAAVAVSTALAGPAAADTRPSNPASSATPVTVSADSLPTPQIDGVVWTQTIVGSTVYVGGKFTTARPAGVALGGVGSVARFNMLSYNLTTGALNPLFAPQFNGQIRAIVATSDQKHLYVGGAFTAVGKSGANHVVELDAKTGAVVTSFRASANGNVNALALRGDKNTLFMGGDFTSVDSRTRTRLAAVAANIGILRAWTPSASSTVRALALAPDYSKVIVAGSFTTLDSKSNPGYGIGAVTTTSGSILPWKMNSVVRDAGVNSGITSLAGDNSSVYGSGYVFGAGGNLEGTFRADWKTGSITWLEDCHGDTYSVAATSNALYVAGHAHFCGNIGGFPQGTAEQNYRGIAFSKAVTQKVATNTTGAYANFAGQPAPSLLNWYPNFDVGTYTGQSQGPWSVAANAQYVVYGGEFTTVNGVAQQGLTRFAIPSIAPNAMGPMRSGYEFNPTVTSKSNGYGTGNATITWTSNADQDNADLTYSIYRDGNMTTPILTETAPSSIWNTPTLTFTDTGAGAGAGSTGTLASGSTHQYRLRATDPWGNTVLSDNVSVTIS